MFPRDVTTVTGGSLNARRNSIVPGDSTTSDGELSTMSVNSAYVCGGLPDLSVNAAYVCGGLADLSVNSTYVCGGSPDLSVN